MCGVCRLGVAFVVWLWRVRGVGGLWFVRCSGWRSGWVVGWVCLGSALSLCVVFVVQFKFSTVAVVFSRVWGVGCLLCC